MVSIYIQWRKGDVDGSRAVFERVCQREPECGFKGVDELAQCYAAWVEMELRAEAWDRALEVARTAVAPVPKGEASGRVATGDRADDQGRVIAGRRRYGVDV